MLRQRVYSYLSCVADLGFEGVIISTFSSFTGQRKGKKSASVYKNWKILSVTGEFHCYDIASCPVRAMAEGSHFSVTDQYIFQSVKKIEWKIARFFDLPKASDYQLNSPHFSFLDQKWWLRFFPNGEERHSPRHISLYLKRENFLKPVIVSFTLGIRRADGSVFKSFDCKYEFKTPGIAWGAALIEKSEFLSSRDVVAGDGTLRLFCSAHLGDGQTSSSQTDTTLSENLEELFRSRYEGDVTVRVGGKEFRVHKAILAARSSVFRAMFETDMAERNDGIVNIDDCEPGPFEDFLLFLYGGRFDVVRSNSALKLCLIADKYNVVQLKEACFERMKKEISAKSVCDAVYLATLYNDEELINTATDYFIENMEKVISTPEWFSFLLEHPAMANELLLKMAKKSKN